jgi:hypothetical protein
VIQRAFDYITADFSTDERAALYSTTARCGFTAYDLAPGGASAKGAFQLLKNTAW